MVVLAIVDADAFPYFKSHYSPGCEVCSSQASLFPVSLIHLVLFISSFLLPWFKPFPLPKMPPSLFPLKFYFSSKTHHCWHCLCDPLLIDHSFLRMPAVIRSFSTVPILVHMHMGVESHLLRMIQDKRKKRWGRERGHEADGKPRLHL